MRKRKIIGRGKKLRQQKSENEKEIGVSITQEKKRPARQTAHRGNWGEGNVPTQIYPQLKINGGASAFTMVLRPWLGAKNPKKVTINGLAIKTTQTKKKKDEVEWN